MGMVAVIYKKGAPDNFVWEETKVGSPECGQLRLRSTAVGVNFADTYHRAGIPHPMIVGDPPGLDCHASICVNGSKKTTSRHSIHTKRISCRSYATKLDRYQTRIAVSRSLARQSFTATSPISPASLPIRSSAISKPKLLKCCDASMSFSTSRGPTNQSY